MALNLVVGTEYLYTEQQLWAELGKTGTFQAWAWVIDPAASQMPPGMTATASQISGTPTAAGTFSVLMRESDDYGEPVSSGTVQIVIAAAPSEPEPDPEPVPEDPAPEWSPEAMAVARFLGRSADAKVLALAEAQLPIVTAFVRAYTRGNGFVADKPGADLAAVITTATARLTVNPEQSSRVTVGDVTENPAVLDGFTLPELGVLHLYRRRTA